MTRPGSTADDNGGLCEGCNEPLRQPQRTYPVMLGGGLGMGTMWLCPKCISAREARKGSDVAAPESLAQKQVRLILERQCRSLADIVKAHSPAGTSFVLFLADDGDSGHMAYVASMERRSAIDLVVDWLDRQDENADAKSLRALMSSAGDFIGRLAREAGLNEDVGPEVLLQRVRELRKKADGK